MNEYCKSKVPNFEHATLSDDNFTLEISINRLIRSIVSHST